MPQANLGSLDRCGKAAFKRAACGATPAGKRGLTYAQNGVLEQAAQKAAEAEAVAAEIDGIIFDAMNPAAVDEN